VRFYERRGLLPPPPRTRGGQRAYPAEALERVRFVRRAQALGFSLAEVKELLDLRSPGGGGRCADVRRRARAKLADVVAKLRDLQEVRRELRRLIDACPGRGGVEDCPILIGLDGVGRPPRAARRRQPGVPAT
jgi:DNA-binding transcriptional MerR regulator